MVEKVKVACAARLNARETLIIARTDARQSEGFESAIQRGIAYGEAGADIVFLEALESEGEMREACKRISKPMMANMADGGKTPIRSKHELKDIGYALAIYPSISGLSASAAIENALQVFKQEGTSDSPRSPLFNFREFQSLIGFEEVWAFERRWARADEGKKLP